ncbi:hypothetical protein [Streptomyces longwoodensis]|uniref:hypothetical protein n=1 Tax=Streptomyces longwoodensis TaxID=68231 RepID=UPI00385055C7
MSSVPITVHRPSASGGRRATVHRHGREQVLGTAHSDHDLVVFLESAGVTDPDAALDDPQRVEWRDGPAHVFHRRLAPRSGASGPGEELRRE